MQPKISILIPFYNCAYVDRAIESALNQTYANAETIVIDDGSTEHTSLLAPYKNQIRYLHKSNGGTASALNMGIRNAEGPYISWLSSDDVFYPDKLEAQIEFMKEHGAEACYTDFDIINETGVTILSSASAKFQSKIDFYRHFLRGNPVNGCTVMMTKELLYRFKLFNERLPYTHDFDLWFRILLSETNLFYMDRRTVKYRRHAQSDSVRKEEQMNKEIERTMDRYAARMQARIEAMQP